MGGRPSRTALLIAAVALSTALVAALACALESLTAGMELKIRATLGRADLRVKEVAQGRFDASVLELVRADPDVVLAVPRLRGSMTLRQPLTGLGMTGQVVGVEPALEAELLKRPMARGRDLAGDGEVVLNVDWAQLVGASVGETVRPARGSGLAGGSAGGGGSDGLEVVGVARRTTGDVVPRMEGVVTRTTLERLAGAHGKLSEILVVLREGADAPRAAERLGAIVPGGVLVQTTERVTSGVGKAMRAGTLGFLLASVLAYLSSAFVVLTGLTTGIIERQRELAILRCLGAERGTLARAQLLVGAVIGGTGAVLGVPLGIALAWVVAWMWPDKLPAGLVTPVLGLAVAFAGSVVAGLAGSAWPAWSASRAAPLEAMRARATPVRARGVWAAGLGGLGMAAWQLLIVGVPDSSRVVFWGYVTTGLPLMLAGYFLLGVPLVVLVARGMGAAVSRVLRLPGGVVERTVSGSPYRFGFTAGALMVGVAMMNSIWTNGTAVLRDWLDAITFPDAFAHDFAGMTREDQEAIEALDFVSGTCAITMFKIDSKAFGLEELRSPPTNFVAFEPEAFFAMTRLAWVAGDEAYARRRLAEGGAVLVAKEFLVARNGYAVGDQLAVTHEGQRHEFEIVGAVSSPGLDIVSAAFDIGKEYADQAIGSIFGTRADLERVFQSRAIHLIQIGYARDVNDNEAAGRIRAALNRPTVVVGSGRLIKETILQIGHSSLRIASILAIGAMFIGCLSVGNVVIAGIEARRFEFGVLRAVGAGRWMLARLVLAEVLVVAVTACVLGTGMALQGSYAAIRLYELLAGIELHLRPPIGPIVLGWGMLVTMTLLIALPMAVRLARSSPRALLGSTRG